MCVYVYVCPYMCVFVQVFVPPCVCVRVCVYEHKHAVWHTHAPTHIHIHTRTQTSVASHPNFSAYAHVRAKVGGGMEEKIRLCRPARILWLELKILSQPIRLQQILN